MVKPDSSAPLAPGQVYTPNSPHSWSISSVDEALGMVYVPLGNQVPDQIGIGRSAKPGMNWDVAMLPVYAGTERKNSLVGGASLTAEEFASIVRFRSHHGR